MPDGLPIPFAGRPPPKGGGNPLLKKLNGKHLRIVALHCAGVKGIDIAADMGMSAVRISGILNDPLVVAEIRRQYVELDNELFAKSVEVVRDGLENADKALALRAADMVWRSRGRYAPTDANKGASAEDIVSKMLQIAQEHGCVSVSVRAGNAPPPPTGADPVLTRLIEGACEDE